MKKTQAFTLIELIVVMILLVVLSTTGFVYFKNYPLQARDSVRLRDLNEVLEKSLELYKSQTGEYPLPSDFTIIEDSGKKWMNGTFGESLVQKIKGLEKLPVDPKTKKPYKYLLSNDRKTYKLISDLETKKNQYVVSNINRKVLE